MKKMVLLAAVMTMFISSASAQFYPDGRPIHPSKRGVYYGNGGRVVHSRYHSLDSYCGFRVGMGLATVNSDSPYLDGSKVKTGLNVGFVAGTQMVHGTPLYVEGGLYYTEKGGKSGSGSDKFTYNMNYLEVPLVLKYKFYPASNFTIEPFMGGYVSCGVGGKIKDFNNRAAYSSFGDKYADNFRRFDAGIKLGCGVGFDIFYLGASYDIGLANVGKDSFQDTHTGCFNLDFGINF
ncbi:MAG: PorT family protein [Prevotella sp.]|nr:PorT family protein [Prevotella sp.]